MVKSIIGTLEERRCMALADFYLGQVAPQEDNERLEKLNLTSLNDLYQYLLLDSQVGQELETARLAEAIACLQQYIGAIYSGMEPGHTKEFSKEELAAWHQRYCNISDWAGYQMLLDCPENWINPTLRLKKSDSFKELENNLGQASLSEAAVQMALFEHLKQFEEVCNLDLISAYIDSVEGNQGKKGEDFKNADYYFIGRQRVQPFGYFWRKAQVELNTTCEFLNPAAWTEWKPIGIPASATVLAMRPVFFAGRLMVVQVEGFQAPDRTEKDEDGNEITVKGTWQIEAKLSYLAVNGVWSPPLILGKKEFAKASEDSARLVVVTFAGTKKDVDDLLAVCFTTTDLPPGQLAAADEQEHGWIFAARNALFEPQPPNIASLKVLANGRFANQYSLQHKLLISEHSLLSQVRVPPSIVAAVDQTQEGELSKFLSLNINFSSRQSLVAGTIENVNILQIQGVYDFAKFSFNVKDLSMILESSDDLNKYFFYHLYSYGHNPNILVLHCSLDSPIDLSFCLDNESGKPIVVSVFKQSEFQLSNGQYVLKKDLHLTPRQRETLASFRRPGILQGAGFTVLKGGTYTPIASSRNKLSISKEQETATLALKVLDGATVLPGEWKALNTLSGWFQTPWIEHRWTGDPVGEKLSVVWGESADGRYGRDRYDIEIKQVPNASSVPLLSKQASGAQFLDIRPLNLTTLKWIRLNSLFGPELVAKAAISIDAVLSLATQNTPEPQPVGAHPATAPIDFNSAHGAFYWELFFHLPFLIAHRLCEERNYHESQRWYQYIFNPHIREPRTGDKNPSDRYWLCRPLLEKGDICFEAQGLVDPDAIAFSNRIHYRKTIFVAYVRCIIAHADSLYRRLTRDSLAAAKLQYVRALSLMGAAPTAKVMSHWVPKSAGVILQPKAGASSLSRFAQSLDVKVANLPARVEGTPDFEIVDLDEFRPATNDQLLNIWKYIEECLWNMRHNLTIDGKPMSLALYAPPTNPLDLLRAQAGGSAGASRNAGGWLNIPHYRFRTLLSTAQNAVQTLIGFGREVRQLMEMRDRGQLEELQQSHVIALGGHAKTIQEETIKQLEASEAALKQSQKMIQERADHYKDISGGSLLAVEIAGDSLALAGKLLGVASIVPHAVGGAINGGIKEQVLAGTVGPFPAALAGTVGGERGAPLEKVALGMTLLGGAAYAGGEAAQRYAFYERRAQEWSFAEAQANSELGVVAEQLKAHEHTLKAARASLVQTQKANEQAQELYSFYKTRATNVELYRWLLSQMATLYFQTYDAVVGLCLSAEASWQYEMGDFDTRIIRPNVWMDNRHGLSAGESMLLDLLRLERDFLNRNERRLELTKTISLRQLFEQGQFTAAKTWKEVLAELTKGKLDFELSQRLFDSDYPGHYCRQITTVALSLPLVLGPYQDARATLTQTGSTTVLKANVDSLEYLYGDGSQIPPPDILLNLRSQQQVGISHGLDDAGLHQLMFGDERYLPFEGTGAVSRWQLHFPRHKSPQQEKQIKSLTDIVVHVRYLAKAGGTAYTDAVLDKLGD
ncbi:neuraminidase-like domain-containing protein [Pseudomonas sp. N3-W]|uniref:Tc toxin subunit A-related protein n=1 Tax=Pseudomonas sp. N3-W TaxID=2975049 RepID=UPI00217DB187|nr:neuraminidase-like domain-containing protein [Pseudomonas sp. N3-W]UWF52169.1 neuraminidase-like domain-containing protein [Pseudomonas sp. N3-W]